MKKAILFILFLSVNSIAVPPDYMCRGNAPKIISNEELYKWDSSNFTNPSLHNSLKFLYLTVSITGERSVKSLKDFFNSAPKKTLVSASVVNETGRHIPYLSYGAIIEAPIENIVATYAGDQGALNSGWGGPDGTHRFYTNVESTVFAEMCEKREDYLNFDTYTAYLQRKFGVSGPTELIASSPYEGEPDENIYNEITIRHTGPSGQKMKVLGVFFYNEGQELSHVKEKAIAEAQNLNLPFIEIEY